jgi:GH18 family chitinase
LKQKLGSTYSLSVAIGSGSWRTDLSYDIPTIFATCDFVNLMSYDLHGGWETKTGIHAGLYKSSLDYTSANVDDSVKLLLNKGVSKNKLIVGIPAYGNAFRLANANNNGVGAPASGAGSLKFNQICPRTNSGSLNYRWDNDQRVPYAFAGTEWVGYDDVRSVKEKANYINGLGLGGAMIWAVDSDDYSGACGLGKYPLISAIYGIVVGGGTVS